MDEIAAPKACPFCGGGAKIEEGRLSSFFVQCTDCKVRTPDYVATSVYPSVTAWNMRQDTRWQPIETVPEYLKVLVYRSHCYAEDVDVVEYIEVAIGTGDPDWPVETDKGPVAKGVFSHWMPIPRSPRAIRSPVLSESGKPDDGER